MAIVLSTTITSALTVEPPADNADAYPLLQNAIDRCEMGEEVHLQPGPYRISQPLRLHSNMRFTGAHAEKTPIIYMGEERGVILSLTGCEDVEVSHITLDGANNPNAEQGVAAGNACRLNLHHLVIRDFVKGEGFGPHGILFAGKNPTKENGVTDSVIDSCLIKNIAVDAPFGCGIRMSWGSSRNRITNNVIQSTGRGGIFGDNGSSHLIIQHNTVDDSHGEGLAIEVWGGCDYSVIEDNVMDHWLSIGGSNYCAARRNVISDTSGTYKFCGIEAIGDHLIITNNTVNGGAKIGLSVSNVDPNHFVYWGNNTVRNCNQWGAQIQGEKGGAAYQYFYGCTFADMPLDTGPVWYPGDEGHGFRFNGNVYGITLENCAFTDNGRLGVQFTGKGINKIAFYECLFQNNKGRAVGAISPETCLNFTDCVFEGNVQNTPPETTSWEGTSPEVSFEMPPTANAGEPIRFQNTSRGISNDLLEVLWDFSDGAPSSEQNPEHTFHDGGTYTITLIVWDKEGRAERCEQKFTVKK